MNWFALALIALMAGAGLLDAVNGQWWRALYFTAGAALNVAVMRMSGN